MAATDGDIGPAPGFDFESSFDRLAPTACRVEGILLVGLQRTQSSVVERELLRVREARTLEEVRDAALTAYEELMALDIFDGVDLVLSESAKASRRVVVGGGGCGGGDTTSRRAALLVVVDPSRARWLRFALLPGATLNPFTESPGVQGGSACTMVARFQEKNMLRLHAGAYAQGTEGGCAFPPLKRRTHRQLGLHALLSTHHACRSCCCLHSTAGRNACASLSVTQHRIVACRRLR